jgi:acyl dehydratase
MRVLAGPEAVVAAAGSELGASDWVEVDQERINRFAEATGDFQWIHVDVERAKAELPSGVTIAHGYLTLSLVPLFIKSVVKVEGVRRSLNYGSNRVRYPAPVKAGSRVRGHVRLTEVVDAGANALRLTYGTLVEVENSERPACIAETVSVHYW